MNPFVPPSASPRPPAVLRYGVAIGLVILALAVSLLFRPLIAPVPFILFFAAIAVNAWYGGLRVGLLSALASLLLTNYFLIPPLNAFALEPGDLLRSLVFLFVAGMISWLSEARRRAETQAYVQAERFYVTLASIGDAVIVTDALGKITFMNAVAEQLTCWTLADALGQDIARVFHIINAGTRKEVDSPVAQVLREGITVGLASHTLLIARDGTERPIDDSGAPIKNGSGELIGAVLVFRDITERVAAEEGYASLLAREQAARAAAESAVGLRDQFLSIAAHELKTPLTSLMGQAQLFQRRATRDRHLNERDQRSLQIVNEQIARLHKMIAALLDVSRLELGQLSIELAPVDICALVRRVVSEARITAEGRSIGLSCPDGPIVVQGDELRLEQAIQNLIQNALKYSQPPQPISVTLTAEEWRVCIAVQDHGIGIPEAALPHLFQRFYRADNAEARQISGMGIGLYVVKEVITLHRGEVAVDSAEGVGSTFTVCLPRS